MKFESVIALPAAWTSVCGQFALHLFEGHLSIADMNHMQDLASRWLLKNPQRRVELSVVLPSGARMTLEERKRIVSLIKQGEVLRAAAGTVILAEGLQGSVQRSVLTGLMLLAPPPNPAKVFATIDAGVSWLLPHLQALTGARQEPGAWLAAVNAHFAKFRARTRDEARASR